MEQFSVKLSGLNQRVEEEQNIIKSLSDIESSLWDVRNGLGFKVAGQSGIRNALKGLAQRTQVHEAGMKSLRSSLKNVSLEYEKTERRICGYKTDHALTMDEIWEALTTASQGLAFSVLFPGMGTYGLIKEILQDSDNEWDIKNKFGKGSFKLWDINDNEDLANKKFFGKDNLGKEHYEWEDGKWVKKDPKKSDSDPDAKKMLEAMDSIKLWQGSASVSDSLLDFSTGGEGEGYNYSASADVMKAEAKASGYLSMASAGFELGVALSAFSANAKGQLGDDMLGVHGNVQVDVGKVDASASGKFGFLGEDGHFDPSLKASVKAEAIAAEISGTAGVDILGTDVDVKGSLNFGIGAHADVGYDDGKFSMDIGASLGVGASVKLEVDVGGTIDMVADCAAEVTSAVGDAVSGAVDAVGDFASGAKDALSSGWNTFKGWF